MGRILRSSRDRTDSEIFGRVIKYITNISLFPQIGLYTDESPGLKVDPVVVLVLSLGFIFSVVALHSQFLHPFSYHSPLWEL